jgi:hypothetical protein
MINAGTFVAFLEGHCLQMSMDIAICAGRSPGLRISHPHSGRFEKFAQSSMDTLGAFAQFFDARVEFWVVPQIIGVIRVVIGGRMEFID